MEEKVYEYLNRLVSVPGISDTDEERKTAEAIREIIAEQPYFKAYPENFGTVEIPGDARKRPLVYGLVRGNKKSGRTIILTGHYDVVSVEDYGKLKPLAFSMDELKAELEKEYGERVMWTPKKTVKKAAWKLVRKSTKKLEKEQKFLRERPAGQLRIRSRISGTMWHPVSGSSGAERRT